MQDHIHSQLVNDPRGLQKTRLLHETGVESKEQLCSFYAKSCRFKLSQRIFTTVSQVRSSYVQFTQDQTDSHLVNASLPPYPEVRSSWSIYAGFANPMCSFPRLLHDSGVESNKQLCSIFSRLQRFPLSQRPRRASKSEAFA